eukprot:TRINITY_DN3444_c0_g3_i1.p1 TRINITY_DN3444_c0_g3~~TRINITY_DN3444_c0_g3_i1.p1  ORF type:complete len:363 (+),score=31.68 TRINITY_DN3444_c0_g3_i1:68-1156(+)
MAMQASFDDVLGNPPLSPTACPPLSPTATCTVNHPARQTTASAGTDIQLTGPDGDPISAFTTGSASRQTTWQPGTLSPTSRSHTSRVLSITSAGQRQRTVSTMSTGPDQRRSRCTEARTNSQWSMFSVPNGMVIPDAPRPPTSARSSLVSPRSLAHSTHTGDTILASQDVKAPTARAAGNWLPPAVTVTPSTLPPPQREEGVPSLAVNYSRGNLSCAPTEPQGGRLSTVRTSISDQDDLDEELLPEGPPSVGSAETVQQFCPRPPTGQRGSGPSCRPPPLPASPPALYEQEPILSVAAQGNRPIPRAPSLPDATDVDCGPIPWYLICDTIPAQQGDRNKLVVNKQRLAAVTQAILSGEHAGQ